MIKKGLEVNKNCKSILKEKMYLIVGIKPPK